MKRRKSIIFAVVAFLLLSCVGVIKAGTMTVSADTATESTEETRILTTRKRP